MIRLIAVAGLALTVATSPQAITPAPIPQLDDGMITPVIAGCGLGRTLVHRFYETAYVEDSQFPTWVLGFLL